MPGCTVPHCTNRSNVGYKLYGLPRGKSNEERRRLWERNIGRHDLPNSAVVCEVHFTNDQFENKRQDGRRLLKWNSVPTLFPDKNGILSIVKPGGPLEKLASDEGIIEESSVVCDAVTTSESSPVPKMGRVTNKPKTISILKKNLQIYRFKDNQQGDEKSARNKENSSIEAKNTKDQENMEQLRMQLQSSLTENERLKDEIKTLHNTLNCFNKDQLYYLKNNTIEGFEWTDETIVKGLKLYTACGKVGYEEVRKQNLPYPSVRTLQSRSQNVTFVPDMLDDVFGTFEVIGKINTKEEIR